MTLKILTPILLLKNINYTMNTFKSKIGVLFSPAIQIILKEDLRTDETLLIILINPINNLV